MATMLELLRERGLLAKRSIGGWVLLGAGVVWKFLSSASTVAWLLGWLHHSSAVRPTPHGPVTVGGGMLSGSGSVISATLFVAGLLWLTAIVFVPVLRSNIHAKILRATFIARHPFDALTRSAMQTMRIPFGPTEHDLLMRVFIVNRAISPITVQRIEAEAEIDDTWVKLRPSELDNYADEKVEDRRIANSGLRNLGIKRIPLDGLWMKLKEQPLQRGVHKEGWLAFELAIDPEKVEKRKVNFRLIVVDSLGGKHPVLNTGEIDENHQITYSAKALEP